MGETAYKKEEKHLNYKSKSHQSGIFYFPVHLAQKIHSYSIHNRIDPHQVTQIPFLSWEVFDSKDDSGQKKDITCDGNDLAHVCT